MRAVLILVVLAGCAESIDTEGLPSVVDYDQWDRFDVTGAVPGHGDTYRIIYVNDVGRAYGHAGRYRPGTVLVKEIHARDGDQPGALQYIGVMRRIEWDDPVAEGLPLQDEWLFTDLEEDGGEVHYDFCWQRCHRAAPWAGAWYDYGTQ